MRTVQSSLSSAVGSSAIVLAGEPAAGCRFNPSRNIRVAGALPDLFPTICKAYTCRDAQPGWQWKAFAAASRARRAVGESDRWKLYTRRAPADLLQKACSVQPDMLARLLSNN